MKVRGREHVMSECQMISAIFLGDRINTSISQQLVAGSVWCSEERAELAASDSTTAFLSES